MQDLSLHILNIAENSIRANASRIQIVLIESVTSDLLTLIVEDNGKGMKPALLKQAADPFVTTKINRKTGLGLAFLKQDCMVSEGELDIRSKPGKGTVIKATMRYHQVDRPPLGDIAGSLCALTLTYPGIAFGYTHQYEDRQFTVDLAKIRNEAGSEAEAIKQFIEQQLELIRKR